MLYVKKDLNVRMSALAESVTLPFSASNTPFETYTKFFLAFITSCKHTEREGNLFRLQERGLFLYKKSHSPCLSLTMNSETLGAGCTSRDSSHLILFSYCASFYTQHQHVLQTVFTHRSCPALTQEGASAGTTG